MHDPEQTPWTPGPASCVQRALPALLLALTLTGCATAYKPAPIQQEPLPASLTAPESEPLSSYSLRARDWLKKAADTLQRLGQTDKP